MATSNHGGGKRVILAGGSGFVGVSLAQYLAERGYEVVILSRRPLKVVGPWRHVAWDARSLGDWRHELDGAAALVNLAGRSVDCIKTADHCDEILRSRVEATRVLGEAVRSVDHPPPVWVQMSTAHIYGDPPEVMCDEDSPPGFGLAPHVAQAWEAEFHRAVLPTQRWSILRTSFVIGRDRGVGASAMSKLTLLTKLGLGGRVASGTQGISWIHETDLQRLIERAIVDDAMHGVYVASVPEPVSQAEFMRQLRRAIGMPLGLPSADWMVRVGARLLLRTDPELVLYGRYVRSKRLTEEGFEFHYADLQTAFDDILRPVRSRRDSRSAGLPTLVCNRG
jgi:uncharacterized protein (TIGR01777 family)